MLDEQVVAESQTAHIRPDDAVTERDQGHCGAHIIDVYKIPKMIPKGEPVKIGGILWQDAYESDTEFEYEIDIIKHHADCDALKYGQECALDWYLGHDGWREFLESSQFLEPFTESPEGLWKVWVCWERSFVDSYHHYGWEYDNYLDFVRISKEDYEGEQCLRKSVGNSTIGPLPSRV